ncbi:hypothetical protein GFH30_09985 [Acinetobacter wanghuae]|uniref:Pilus assembly protein PilP n=2 Tax=Acinetobacter wanghuae TaxID=2662362 RepID=A0A5Q0P3D2_9GAMM|nr:NF038215 family lipoprotein [Acinetobacter wanghuae]MQW91410.1 hypothetical protein [Acinetobacter wanghuae]QGA11687.1 hypothetical protein GFH30_09985 [Acinetobacter wanghuae]
MKIRSLIFISMFAVSFTACDPIDNRNTPQTRSMIIGGVPVHDRDYQLLADQVAIQKQPVMPLPADPLK